MSSNEVMRTILIVVRDTARSKQSNIRVSHDATVQEILDGAVIGDHCIVGANALVTQRFVAPPGSMILGAPAKVVRPLTAAELASLRPWAEKYVAVARAHAARGR